MKMLKKVGWCLVWIPVIAMMMVAMPVSITIVTFRLAVFVADEVDNLLDEWKEV